MSMMIPVWLIYKRGEPRVYARTTPIPLDLSRRWRADGFKIYRSDLYMPEEDVQDIDGVLARRSVELVDDNDPDTSG